MFTVYILFSDSSEKYYIGHTNNLERRLEEHNDVDRVGWSNSYRPWHLIYSENHNTRSEAVRSERYLKSLKNKDRLREYIAGWRSSISRGS